MILHGMRLSILLYLCINDYYSGGKEFVIDKDPFEIDENLGRNLKKKLLKFLMKK